MQLFTQKGRSIEGIPPTKAALIQHTKRATYQAGYCWGQVMIAPGQGRSQMVGKETRQLCQKLQRLVENFCDVAARKVEDVNANV